jgi:CubicO group peptidase (beta-lactamase class C family)
MGHVAGVKSDGGDEGPLMTKHCERPVQGLEAFADAPLLFEPGTRFRYSSYGWILLSAAIEAAEGEPFLAVMRRRVFDPLGMRDTRADSATSPVAGRVTFYFPRFAADPAYGLHLMRDLDFSCYAGSSIFLSTASDLVRFGMGINGGKLIRRETVRLMQTPVKLTSGDETGYGLGWELEKATLAGRQERLAGHDGETLGGMIASLVTLPERGIVVAVMSNISYADTYSLGVRIAGVFLTGELSD